MIAPDLDAMIEQLQSGSYIEARERNPFAGPMTLIEPGVASKAAAALAELQERARMIDASISCAAMGHYKRGEPMHDDYKTVGLNDVLDLRDKWIAAEAEVARLKDAPSTLALSNALEDFRVALRRIAALEAEREGLADILARWKRIEAAMSGKDFS